MRPQDLLEPPVTIVPPPDHVLCERIRRERSRGGILIPASASNGAGGSAADDAPLQQPRLLARVLRSGPLLSGKWEACEPPWREGDQVMIGMVPPWEVAGDLIMVNVDAIIAVVRPGEHGEEGEVVHGEIREEHPEPPNLLRPVRDPE